MVLLSFSSERRVSLLEKREKERMGLNYCQSVGRNLSTNKETLSSSPPEGGGGWRVPKNPVSGPNVSVLEILAASCYEMPGVAQSCLQSPFSLSITIGLTQFWVTALKRESHVVYRDHLVYQSPGTVLFDLVLGVLD